MKRLLSSRFRVATVLVVVLALSSTGASLASTSGKGRIVSAHLTKTSLTSAKARKVKLVYKVSPTSKSISYLLTKKSGTKWVKVRRTSKKGAFKGSYSVTVKKLFGPKAVKVGQYRVRVSADRNSLTRKFKVVKAAVPLPAAFQKTSPINGAVNQTIPVRLSWGGSRGATSYEYCVDTVNNSVCDGAWAPTATPDTSGLHESTTYYWQIRARNARGTTEANGGTWFSFTTLSPKPTGGFWLGSGTDGAITYVVTFNVSASGAQVTNFSVTFDIPSCGVYGGIVTAPGPFSVATDAFSSVTGSPTFSGLFDSSSYAHGTSRVIAYSTSGCGLVTLEPATWTASWHSAS